MEVHTNTYLTSTTMFPKSVITGPSFRKAFRISGSERENEKLYTSFSNSNQKLKNNLQKARVSKMLIKIFYSAI